MALGLIALLGGTAPAHAGAPCTLPVAFALSVERRGVAETGGPGLVVTAAPAGGSVVSGDAIRQANGARVTACVDLERVAAEALAKGLALLLGVERGGAFVAVAARAQPSSDANGAAPTGEGVSAAPTAGTGVAAQDETTSIAAPPRATPKPAHSPEARRAAPLPSGAERSTDLRRTAAAAAGALAEIDAAARLSVPLVLYERRLIDAEKAVAALAFGEGKAGADVHAAVQEILDYHRTARDVRRTKLEILSQRGVDHRAAAANALPYFSDSKVPEWIAAYPFLQASLIEPPHETRMLLSGEVAGRWDPDRALDLLWAHARSANARLAEWARQ